MAENKILHPQNEVEGNFSIRTSLIRESISRYKALLKDFRDCGIITKKEYSSMYITIDAIDTLLIAWEHNEESLIHLNKYKKDLEKLLAKKYTEFIKSWSEKWEVLS
jgi:hypothetical protein